MNEDMEKLVSLQQIDSQIAGFDHAIAKCETDVARREQDIQAEQEKLAALRTKIELLTEKQKENQVEHDAAAARSKESQNKMLMVQTSREHQALLKEIEDSRKQIKATEDRAIQFIEQLEQLETEAKQLESRLAGEQEELNRIRQQSTKEINRLKTGRKSVESERDERVAAVPEALMRRYEKLMDKRGGLAVTSLKGGVCQGCHMALPPQQVIEVMKGDQLIACPTCQRLLWYPEPEPEPEAEAPQAKPKAKKTSKKKATKTEPETQPQPEAEGEAAPQPEAAAQPQPEAEAAPQPEAEAQPQPEAEAQPQPEAEAQPQPGEAPPAE